MWSSDDLVRLAYAAARGKRRAPDVAAFILDVDRNVRELGTALSTRTYRPMPGRTFVIRDPKTRRIFALPFRDRVAQHALIATTLPMIERGLAPQSYACRPGKGTHSCLRRAADLFRAKRAVLRVDVRKFFPSIDHAILRRALNRTTPPELRWLRDVFLDGQTAVEKVAFHFPGDELFTPIERPHGLPIGSLTSQIWANVYLAPLDHLLGSKLGIGTFVRYCDDFLIFDDDPERLRTARDELAARATTLRLRLHPNKTRLHRTTDPVPFLGFVLQRTPRGGVSIRLASDNVARFRARMARIQALFAASAIDVDEVRSHLFAWLAHARHGHTRALVANELGRLTFARES